MGGKRLKSDKKILTVKQLTRHIKGLLETDPILSEVWVKAEISNFVHHGSGHMYFTLKDEESRVKAVMFAGNNQYIKFLPKDGTRILAKGYISLFERDGQYQFYVQEMQPDGLGNLFLAYEQLKKKLEEEGLFDPAVKLPIPRYPRCVGVITSPTGAAIRDIITTLFRRFPSVQVLLFPVLVQGEQAAPSIARAIDWMNQLGQCDVMIVGRGGGSIEELWAFNEEIVARSIHASRIPIISAVGHESDVTIADFVADVRAATPTAAAEIAVPHIMEVKQHLGRLKDRLLKSIHYLISDHRERLNRLAKSQVFRRPKQQLEHYTQQLDHLQDRLHYGVDKRLTRLRNKLHTHERKLLAQSPAQKVKYLSERLLTDDRRLKRSIEQSIRSEKQRLGQMLRQLDSLSPLKIMDRGYSLAYEEKNKQLIKSINQVSLGDVVQIRLKDGKLDCQVWSMEVDSDGEGNNGTENI
jgi:exodeoxyribonuclease VII large subunit